MKTHAIGLGILFFATCTLGFAQPPSAANGKDLFLQKEDIPRALRLAPGLVTATNQGTKETHTYLASQELSQRQMSQILTNVSVAYTAIKIEEYLKQLQPLLDDKSKGSQYQQYIAQAQKQLAELTAKYKQTQMAGRSALDVNKEYVINNQAAVEELMVRIRNMKIESLPKE